MLALYDLVERVRSQIATAGICAGRVMRDRNEPSTDKTLPVANVFVSHDEAKPAGDPRSNPFEFIHTTTLCVEVRVAANTGPELKYAMQQQSGLVLACLMRNQAWWGQSSDGVEGLAAVRQVYNLPPEGNERIGGVQVQIDVLWRQIWEPVIGDDVGDFSTLSARVSVPDGTPQPGADVSVPTE